MSTPERNSAICKAYRERNVRKYGPNEKLKAYRRGLGRDGVQILAKELGYAASTIYAYEKGYLPTPNFVNEYIEEKLRGGGWII